jgi:hypothetical protein
MTATARELLDAFDSLPPSEKQQVAAEILRRTVRPDDLPVAAFHELAAELFHGYDNEEATPMPSPKRPGLS